MNLWAIHITSIDPSDAHHFEKCKLRTHSSPTFADVNDEAETTTDTGGCCGGGLTATAKGGAPVAEVEGTTGFTGARMTVAGAPAGVTVGIVVMTVVGARNSTLGCWP